PANKLEIIVVNDGSKDNTAQLVREFMKTHPQVQLINKLNGGKGPAINSALAIAKGELFGVIDADSRIEKDAIKALLQQFNGPKTGAVITRIRVDNPRNFLERMQRFEYIMSSLTRFMMRNFGTLAITHGVLSMFRTNVLRKVGGFVQDRNNITEDFEIALRMRRHGYTVEMEPKAIGYTSVPNTVKSVWRQRIRWSRGYLYNMINYKDLFFSKGQGVFGAFQLPMNVLAVLLLILNVSLISYDFIDRGLSFVQRSFTLSGYFWNTVLDLPSLKEIVLSHNVQIGLPVMLSFVLGLYIIFTAHRIFGERLRNQFLPAIAYLLVMPYFSTVNWISSIAQEVVRTKRKW
ncbi:MAG TPA: glycosyltransferase family 2 protein, partial [Candidatus Nanoarchaeia archaeon]|nr:glycosyltransferase family 2 protein [Candidatus Nanoarchaeia archaeon]